MAKAAEFRQEVVSADLDDLLARLLFEGVPFVFADDMSAFRRWRSEVANLLSVDAFEIIITGSAATGFSLSPTKNLREFQTASDIDVAVVSEIHFSEAWHCLRGIDLTLAALTPAQRSAVKEHSARYIYWGCVATDRVLPILPFATEWMTARSRIASKDPFEGREVNFRVYKDYRALRGYQLQGLKQLRQAVLE